MQCLAAHLEDETINDRLPDVIAEITRPIVPRNRIDELHGRHPAWRVRIEDHAVRKTEPAVFDRPALAINDDELVLMANDEVDSAHQLVASEFVAPRTRHMANVDLDTREHP